MIQRFFLVFPYVLIFFLSSCSRGKEDFHENFSKIEPSDKKTLDLFFSILIKQNEFGYTLFGNKPVSVVSYIAQNNLVSNLSVHSIFLEAGWSDWQKYSLLFPSKNYYLGKYDSKLGDVIVRNLFIVNKKSLLGVLEENKEVLSALGKYSHLETEDWLQNVFNDPKLSQSALGILLGYGTKNSLMFERRTEIALFYLNHPNIFATDRENMSKESQEICLRHGELSENDDLSFLEPSSGFSSLVEEFDYINSQSNSFQLEGTALGITSFGVPEFVVFESNTDENKELEQSYQRTLKMMISRYENRSFLKTTLEQWVK